MTKNKALYAWFNEIMTFYRDTAVPDDAELPYGTYNYVEDVYGGSMVAITVNLWFRTESEAIPDEKVDELSAKLGYDGALIPCDEGYIWLNRGSPFCQSFSDETDSSIKRRYINIIADYLTTT